MSDPIQDEAFVTLVTNDAYVIGALVLCHALRKTHTRRVLVCLISKDVSAVNRSSLNETFDQVIAVETIDSGDAANLALLKRPELGITFTKIHAWNLTQFNKCVFLDADTLVLKNIDSVFDRNTEFAAAPDVGWPDCFNSGVFFYRPSQETYEKLRKMATAPGASFDGGDQGLLNSFFSDWSTRDSSARLPFTYNMTANASYGYVPAFQKFKEDVHVVHFIGQHKPWHGIPQPGPDRHVVISLVEKWWKLHDDYKNCCSESCAYKTLMGARPTRSPGPEGEVHPTTPPPMHQEARPASFSHDLRRPLGSIGSAPGTPVSPASASSYLSSAGFSEIQSRLDQSLSLDRPPALLNETGMDEQQEEGVVAQPRRPSSTGASPSPRRPWSGNR